LPIAHLDGYNQMDLLTGKGPSKRHELFYFGGPALGAVRIDEMKFTFFSQPYGWPGEKVTTDMPILTNLRQDPFERLPSLRGESTNTGSPGYLNDSYAREFWRFVLVQQQVGKLAVDGRRLSTDARPGLVQSRRGEEEGRGDDQASRRPVGSRP
jgi:arylsulfatase